MQRIAGRLESAARNLVEGRRASAADKGDADAGVLLEEYKNAKTDDAAMEWLAATYPDLDKWLRTNDARVDAAAGNAQLAPAVIAELLQGLADRRTHSAWDDVGLPLAYQREATRVLGLEEEAPLLQRLPSQHGVVGLRFAVPANKLGALVPDASMTASWESATKERLRDLQVREHDIDVATVGRAGLFRSGDRTVHVPPHDAALLIDAVVLGDRGSALARDPAWRPVERQQGVGGPKNVFTLPVRSLLGMRGIAFGLAQDAPDEVVTTRTRKRLQQRGVTTPNVEVGRMGGATVVHIPTEEARLLLAPVAEGDPATKLTSQRIAWEPDTKGHHPENAVMLVQCAALSYQKPAQIEALGKKWGLEDFVHIENKTTDAQAFVAYDKEANAIVVAFRGTESRMDLRVDADARTRDGTKYGGPPGSAVHNGFAGQLDSVLDDVKAAIAKLQKPGASILLTGHSLGGSLAALTAGHLLEQGMNVRGLYTFGQPKTGNDVWARALEQKLGGNEAGWFRYVNNNDVVVRVGAGVQGGRCLYFDHHGSLRPDREDLMMRDRTNFVGAVVSSDGIDDHRVHFYIALVRKSRDICVD